MIIVASCCRFYNTHKNSSESEKNGERKKNLFNEYL